MKILLNLMGVLATLTLTACAVGPLVSHETARTVGQGNHEVIGGYGYVGHVIKWNYGVGQNFDLGLQWESLSIGLRAKYAFVNQSAGWSWAGALGIGSSVGGSHYYGDLLGSYRSGAWEPYGTLRWVHVKNSPTEFKNKDTGQVSFVVNLGEYEYGQFILGTRYWFDEHWLLSLEASSFFSMSSAIKVNEGFILGAALGYRFN